MTPDRRTHYHGEIKYARCHVCYCDPCVAAMHRYANRGDGIIDEVAVQRLVDGEPVAATSAERVAAALLLAARGVTYEDAADRMHTTKRTIERYLSAARRRVAA